MVLVSISTLMTVIVLHIHHRGTYAGRPPSWFSRLILDYLARMLCLRSCRSTHGGLPVPRTGISFENAPAVREAGNVLYHKADYSPMEMNNVNVNKKDSHCIGRRHRLQQSLDQIALHLSKIVEKADAEDMEEELKYEWVRIAYVIDRFFMIVFSLVTVTATCSIIFSAPVFW